MSFYKETSWTVADTGWFDEVFQLLCTSRMNSIYYAERLRILQKISLIMECLIAATASGSGIASLLPTDTPYVKAVWQTLLLFAAVCAVVRPLYAPGKKIEIMTRQQHGYMTNFFALKKLAHSIRQSGHVTDDARRRYDTIYDRHVQLASDDEVAPDNKKLAVARTKTAEELSRSRFWWPFTELMPDLDAPPKTGAFGATGAQAAGGSMPPPPAPGGATAPMEAPTTGHAQGLEGDPSIETGPWRTP